MEDIKLDTVNQIYRAYLEDIRYSKQQQWNVIYYYALSMILIYEVFIRLVRSSFITMLIIYFLPLIISFITIYLLINYSKDILKSRCKIDSVIKKKMHYVAREILDVVSDKDITSENDILNDKTLLFFLFIILLGTFLMYSLFPLIHNHNFLDIRVVFISLEVLTITIML